MGGTCKDCMYWVEGGEELSYETLVGMGKCKRAVHLRNSMTYEDIIEDPYQRLVSVNPILKGNMFVKDYEDYYAGFITTPDFGCINFKLKEEV